MLQTGDVFVHLNVFPLLRGKTMCLVVSVLELR